MANKNTRKVAMRRKRRQAEKALENFNRFLENRVVYLSLSVQPVEEGKTDQFPYHYPTLLKDTPAISGAISNYTDCIYSYEFPNVFVDPITRVEFFLPEEWSESVIFFMTFRRGDQTTGPVDEHLVNWCHSQLETLQNVLKENGYDIVLRDFQFNFCFAKKMI